MQVFEERGNRSTQGKFSQSREENQPTQPIYDTESGNRTRATLVGGECSHHCATTALVGSYDLELLFLSELGDFFLYVCVYVLYRLLGRSPIAEHVWKIKDLFQRALQDVFQEALL